METRGPPRRAGLIGRNSRLAPPATSSKVNSSHQTPPIQQLNSELIKSRPIKSQLVSRKYFYAMQIWTRYVQILERTKPSSCIVWPGAVSGLLGLKSTQGCPHRTRLAAGPCCGACPASREGPLKMKILVSGNEKGQVQPRPLIAGRVPGHIRNRYDIAFSYLQIEQQRS